MAARMKSRVLSVLVVALLSSGAADPTELSTQRRVHGVITAVAPDKFTIESAQYTVTGRIDPNRTRVTVNGKAARIADLKVSDHAKAELCLDDVWVSIDTH
jgi:hypothetical protein